MIDAGISPGDLVLVRKQSEAMDGDIIVSDCEIQGVAVKVIKDLA